MPVRAAGARLASMPLEARRFCATWSMERSKLKAVCVAGWLARVARFSLMPGGCWARAKGAAMARAAEKRSLRRQGVMGSLLPVRHVFYGRVTRGIQEFLSW